MPKIASKPKATTRRRTVPISKTPAMIRRSVVAMAKKVADDQGVTLSPAAVRILLAPSRAYFDRNSVRQFNSKALRQALIPLVANAAAQAREDANPIRTFRYPRKGKGFSIQARRNPVKKVTRLNAAYIRVAMKTGKCHYLWFC